MRNQKGLTLVELLAVLALIAVLATIIYPRVSSMMKQSSNDTKNATINAIKESAGMYLADQIQSNNITNKTITVKELVDGGYLQMNEDSYDLTSSTVVIRKSGNKYKYTVTLNKK